MRRADYILTLLLVAGFLWNVAIGVCSAGEVGKPEVEATPLDLQRIDYVARRLWGLVADPEGEHIRPESVKVDLRLNKQTYEIGEPIAATFSVKNVGPDPICFQVGGDYRSGRAERFIFKVIDENGRPAPDQLALRIGYGIAGGLGSEETLERGQTWSKTVLLQLYRCPELPGAYTVQGSYRYQDNPSNGNSFRSAPVTIHVRDRHTGMTNADVADFLRANGLQDLHPAILWGVRGLKKDISALIQVMRTGSVPQNYPPVDSDLAQRNAQGDAGLGLVLMPWKEAVYQALGVALAGGQFSEYDDLFRITYKTAAWPDGVDAVEKHLDDPDPRVRRLAIQTALSLGGKQARERFPEALRSPDEATRFAAVRGVQQYLSRTIDLPGCRLEGLTDAFVEDYRSALCARLRDEISTGPLLRNYIDAILAGRGIPPDLAKTIRDIIDPKRRAELFKALKFAVLVNCNIYGDAFSTEPPETLVSLLRDEALQEWDTETKAAILVLLGFLGDKESVDLLAGYLSSPEEPLRVAAAEALFALRNRRHLAP